MNDLIDFGDIIVTKYLAETKYSKVFIGKKKLSPHKQYIFKTFDYICNNSSTQKQFANTFYVTQQVSHDTLLSYKKFSFTNERMEPKVTFASKYVSEITLKKALMEENFLRNWGTSGALNCMFAIAIGLSHLHSHLIYHGNLCLSNIIIDNAGQSYICDFGLYPIKKLYVTPNKISRATQYYHNKNNSGFKPSDKDDIFAFGIIVCQLFDKVFPKISDTSVIELYQNNSLDQYNIPDILRKLISHCLDPVPEKRFSIKQIIELFQNNEKTCTSFQSFLNSNYVINLANIGDAFALNKLGDMYSDGKGVPKDETKAMQCFYTAAKLGNSRAQSNLGVTLQLEANNWKQIEGAKYLKQSADHADLYGMANYGITLKNGEGVPKNYKKGMKYLKIAADYGLPYAQVNYGLSLIELDDINKKKEGCEYIKLAVDQGDLDAIYTLGACFLEGNGVEKDEKIAMEYFKKAADKGYCLAQYEYAVGLLLGKGVQLDIQKSLELFNSALKGGCEEARFYIDIIHDAQSVASKNNAQFSNQNASNFILDLFSSMKNKLNEQTNLNKEDYEIFQYEDKFIGLRNDKIIDQYATIYDEHPRFHDREKANKYYEMAAKLGNPNSQANYGVYLQEEKHEMEAGLDYLFKSAKKDNNHGLYNYGLALIYGDGTVKNINQGIYYIKRAARKGYSKAQLGYGIILQNMLMPIFDMKKGFHYIEMAAKQNDPEALKQYAICLEEGNGVNVDLWKASSIFEELYTSQNQDEDTLNHLINCLTRCDPQKAEKYIKIKLNLN